MIEAVASYVDALEDGMIDTFNLVEFFEKFDGARVEVDGIKAIIMKVLQNVKERHDARVGIDIRVRYTHIQLCIFCYTTCCLPDTVSNSALNGSSLEIYHNLLPTIYHGAAGGHAAPRQVPALQWKDRCIRSGRGG